MTIVEDQPRVVSPNIFFEMCVLMHSRELININFRLLWVFGWPGFLVLGQESSYALTLVFSSGSNETWVGTKAGIYRDHCDPHTYDHMYT